MHGGNDVIFLGTSRLASQSEPAVLATICPTKPNSLCESKVHSPPPRFVRPFVVDNVLRAFDFNWPHILPTRVKTSTSFFSRRVRSLVDGHIVLDRSEDLDLFLLASSQRALSRFRR